MESGRSLSGAHMEGRVGFGLEQVNSPSKTGWWHHNIDQHVKKSDCEQTW